MGSVSKDELKELAEAPLGGLLMRYSWPSLVAMALNSLYAVVDRMWIGQGCGADAMAGLTLTIPLVMILIAFGVLVGLGHASMISIKLGEKDGDAASRFLGQMVALKLIFFTVLPLAIWFYLDPILTLVGGTSSLIGNGNGVTQGALEAAHSYMVVILAFNVFSHLTFGLSGTMRSEGAALQSMICMSVGFFANIILDPIFIFAMKMGVTGAAWASVVSMILSFLVAIWYYRPGHSVVEFKWRNVRIFRGMLKRPMAIGLSPSLQQLVGALINMSLSMALAKWSPSQEEATRQVASLGIFNATLIVFLMPIFGFQQGAAPIIGYNWGARNYRRVKGTFLCDLALTTVLTVTAFLGFIFAPEHISRFFMDGSDPSLLALSARILVISNCMIWCISLNIAATTLFQSIGRPGIAIILSMLRQFFCLLPCIWILPYFMEDRVFAVWVSMPVSDVLAFVLTIPPVFLYVRFLNRAERIKHRVS